MAFIVTINHKNGKYTSEGIDDVELEDVLYKLEESLSDKTDANFSIKNGNSKHYFPKKALQESIISITQIK